MEKIPGFQRPDSHVILTFLQKPMFFTKILTFQALLMRILNEMEFGSCKVTLMAWNNRYIIKLENGLLEQTFKISQFDLDEESQLPQLLSDRFMQQAMERFAAMEKSLHEALISLQ